MNITLSKVKRQLEKKHKWQNLDQHDFRWFVDHLIKDTIDVINDELIKHKNISIKK
jgi:hypothetical protein